MAQTYRTYGSYENEYGQEYIIPNQRMYVRASVHLPNSELDPRTGMLKPDVPRRGRTQAKRMEYTQLDKEFHQLDAALQERAEHPGLRITLRSAILLIAFTAFLIGILLLGQNGTLAERQKALNRMNRAIEDCAKANDGIAAQIAEASDSSTICYTAARELNMIPGESAEAIHLVAMDTRPLETQAAQAAAQNTQNGGQPMPSAQTAEATTVPAVASAGFTQ